MLEHKLSDFIAHAENESLNLLHLALGSLHLFFA